MYAGLQRVPESLLEAANIDGANGWQTFWKVEFNFIRPEVSMVLILLTDVRISVFFGGWSFLWLKVDA